MVLRDVMVRDAIIRDVVMRALYHTVTRHASPCPASCRTEVGKADLHLPEQVRKRLTHRQRFLAALEFYDRVPGKVA